MRLPREWFVLGLVYCAAAVAITALWTYRARTENQDNKFASIVAITNGSAPRPFVKPGFSATPRRLSHGHAPARAWCFPRPWQLTGDQPWLGWSATGSAGNRRHDRLLISATCADRICRLWGSWSPCEPWCSTSTRPPPGSPVSPVCCLGLSLLGGGGDVRFGFYPNHLPHAFVFALTLTMILVRSGWLLPDLHRRRLQQGDIPAPHPGVRPGQARVAVDGRYSPWRQWL